jgi:uncharacterized cupin superfamily protein
MDEARLRETEHGLVPEGDGWFIVNPRDLAWETIPGSGTWCGFEAPEEKSRSIGIGMHVLQPGEASAMYHAEDAQEGFMILEGECLLVVEGEERLMQQWDYFHCPPGTEHITVGAGDGPCAILMIGARDPDDRIEYPVSEVAARHNASAAETTNTGREAYRDFPPESHDERFDWPLG